jgi:hypothetical protein
VVGQYGRSLLGEVRGQADEESWGDGHDALVPTFAGRHEDATLTWKYIPQPQPEDLTSAESTQEHRFRHGPVTVSAERGQKAVGRLGREHARQCARGS